MAESGAATELKKYQTYSIEVDPEQDDKGKEIKLLSFARPHMRAFHASWVGFFIAFFIWFAAAPLLPEIKKTLGVEKSDIWKSSVTSVAGTILLRFALGPLCDKYGSRTLYFIILNFASIPTAMLGLVNSIEGLIAVRFFIGFAGSCFVMCQYWTSRMFVKEVVGTANALVGGWGNLGGGVTQLVMGSALFPAFKAAYADLGPDAAAEKAWRTVSVIPAIVAAGIGWMIYFFTDDCPKGNYKEMKKNGTMAEVSAAASFREGALNINTWLLFIQYACCFGVELTMNNAAALYFVEKFEMSTEKAAAIASLFGWMNLFARGLGGYFSDKFSAKMGMRGRLLIHTVCLLAEGILVFVFASSDDLGAAIGYMVIFSVFVQAAEGTSYGIVPYVNPPATGSIAGIVGAGGNTGAVCFGLGFTYLNEDLKDPFFLMGGVIVASSVLSFFIFIKGSSGLLCGEDEDMPKETLAVPEKEEETA